MHHSEKQTQIFLMKILRHFLIRGVKVTNYNDQRANLVTLIHLLEMVKRKQVKLHLVQLQLPPDYFIIQNCLT